MQNIQTKTRKKKKFSKIERFTNALTTVSINTQPRFLQHTRGLTPHTGAPTPGFKGHKAKVSSIQEFKGAQSQGIQGAQSQG